ncbi:hypothetical protein GYMLUDRAFT_181302 [Collybiopsis luxurians FD-317 M1]|uniref:Fungal-type protein kinase domain-containing protein n=1 Tax=Collybiopsis luxurians FD-317 M1 TaxID=944289 RepID=A0A0D0C9T6_9AGAR|nr:hypothetical protein GYMLUDRAFT_181302 [Collybiopsis luxurians FD-317 M1]
MCATRSGTSVTESFDYTQDPSLATFFWRLSHSSAETRGIDTTFHRATEGNVEESLEARRALQLLDTAPLYKVSVVDEVSDETSFYLVSDPFTTSHRSPTGRCTRCFRAYDVQWKKIVLLKDSWRVDGYEAEGETYRALNSKGVRNIPQLVAAGNVSGCPGWTCGDEPFLEPQKRRVHHHYRLVLDTIGHSLTHFDSTWQLVNAILDAMIAHQDALERAQRLHRDISVGNIIITDDSRGMLIDWELSKVLDHKEPRSYEKTGTWQFRSVRLLEADSQNPIEHSAGDDVESFFWVLSWVVGRNASSSMTNNVWANFLRSFDSDVYMKKTMLQSGAPTIEGMKLATPQVKNLLIKLWRHFGGRYGSERF